MTESKDSKDKAQPFRRKGSAPLIQRSASHQGLSTSFDSREIPRIVLTGEGGFGKSSLLGYARSVASQAGISVSIVKADEVDKSTPYFIFRSILHDLFEITLLHLKEESPATTVGEATGVTTTQTLTVPEPTDLGKIRQNSSPDLQRLADGGTSPPSPKIATIARSRSIQASSTSFFAKPSSSGNLLSHLQGEAARSEFLEKAERALRLLELDPNAIHLLAPVFPVLGSANSGDVERKDMVGDLIVRVIERFTLLITPLALMIDDAHWMDSLSCKMIWTVVRKCTKVFLVFGTRPQHSVTPSEPTNGSGIPKSYSSVSLANEGEDFNALQGPALRNSVIIPESMKSREGIFTKIQGLPSTVNIVLGGISREAAEKLVVIYCGFNVKTVQEKLLNEIVRKTGGNPFFVERLAANMKGKSCFGVSPSGELILKSGQTLGTSPLDEFDWGDDPESAMLVQFDRLPPDMQLILRTASVFGQSFSLDVVAQVLENNSTAKECFDVVSLFLSQKVLSVPLFQPDYSFFFFFVFRFRRFQIPGPLWDGSSRTPETSSLSIVSSSRVLYSRSASTRRCSLPKSRQFTSPLQGNLRRA